MHTPVLLKETIAHLDIQKGKKYIDATYGEGGHSEEIIKRGGLVLGIEWDEKQIKNKKLKVKSYKNLKLVYGNFADIEKITKDNDFYPVDGVLFDFGLSMNQINESKRGFSFKKTDEPLDMRINSQLTQTAEHIINHSSAHELYEIFSRNSEEINSWTIAHALFRACRIKKIKKVGDVLSILSDNQLKLKGEREGIKRRIFQALRIEVNHEFENIKKGLEGAMHVLIKGGRIAVITFHQGEDRIVTTFIRQYGLELMTKKPIVAAQNHGIFERSAKLRVIILNNI